MRNTFVSTVRCDLRDICVIAEFMRDKDVFVDSRGKIASRAIRILAEVIRKDRGIEQISLSDASLRLIEMGYVSGRSVNQGDKNLAKEINLEQDEARRQTEIDGAIQKFRELNPPAVRVKKEDFEIGGDHNHE